MGMPENPDTAGGRPPALTRRDAIGLGSLAAAGAVIGKVLQGTAPLARDVSGNPTAREALDTRSRRSDGNPKGSVRIVAFNDFLCPICKITSPDLARAVRVDGDVGVEYKDLTIFGPLSEESARIGLAMALRARYPEFHHAMMDARRQVDRNLLRDTVLMLGEDWKQVEAEASRRERRFAAVLNEDARIAFTLGIGGTPAFLIGGLLALGRKSEGEFHTLFEQARNLGT